MGWLQPGLQSDEIERFETKLKLRFPQDLRDLYSWRNGPTGEGATLGELYFFPWMYLATMEEAVSIYNSLSGSKPLVERGGWKRSWFPFFFTGGAAYLVVDCDGGQILDWGGPIVDGSPAVAAYRSVRTMLETFLDCYETGAFSVRDGDLERNQEEFLKIGIRHNPGLKYWTTR
jgi:cell wall assembly regulator SMI1